MKPVKKRGFDPVAARQKRVKVIAIATAVLLVPLMAWSIPHTLKGLHPKPPAAAPPPAAPGPPPATTGGTPVSVPPNGGAPASGPGAGAGDAGTGSTKLAAPDLAPTPGEGQLVTFSVFKTKDPFVQQLSSESPTGASGSPGAGSGTKPTAGSSGSGTTPPRPPSTTPPGGGGSATPPASTPSDTTPPSTSPPSTSPPSTSPPSTEPTTPPISEPPATTPPVTTPPAATPPPTAPPATTPPVTTPPVTAPPATAPPASSKPKVPTAATISINDVPEVVQVGGPFPKATPVFSLVSIKADVVQIGIAGGSLEDGSPTVPLKLGATVTLMNTADGTRYVLKLVSIS